MQELSENKPERCQQFLDFTATEDADIFSLQLANVAALYLQLQQCQTPSKPMYFDTGLAMGETVVKRDPSAGAGVRLEKHFGTTVPFTLDVAAKAYWRFFQLEHGDRLYSCNASTLCTDVSAHSYSLTVDKKGVISKISGKYTCQKHVSEDEITFVWVEHANVSEFGKLKFQGLQYRKRGSIKLRRVFRQSSDQQSTSTVVETHYETTPIFCTSAVNPMQQLSSFIALACGSHGEMSKLVSDTMSDLLLEEDWKATFTEDFN